MQWGAAWFPKGIVYDTAVTISGPCNLNYDTLHVDLGGGCGAGSSSSSSSRRLSFRSIRNIEHF